HLHHEAIDIEQWHRPAVNKRKIVVACDTLGQPLARAFRLRPAIIAVICCAGAEMRRRHANHDEDLRASDRHAGWIAVCDRYSRGTGAHRHQQAEQRWLEPAHAQGWVAGSSGSAITTLECLRSFASTMFRWAPGAAST